MTWGNDHELPFLTTIFYKLPICILSSTFLLQPCRSVQVYRRAGEVGLLPALAGWPEAPGIPPRPEKFDGFFTFIAVRSCLFLNTALLLPTNEKFDFDPNSFVVSVLCSRCVPLLVSVHGHALCPKCRSTIRGQPIYNYEHTYIHTSDHAITTVQNKTKSSPTLTGRRTCSLRKRRHFLGPRWWFRHRLSPCAALRQRRAARTSVGPGDPR